MFVKNINKKPIEVRSFEGYKFLIPVGVSAVLDKLGKHLLEKIYKVESKGKQDKYGFDNGHGVPPLMESDRKAWEKDGKKLAQVERFQINVKQIPRANLIKIAQERGVESGQVVKWLADKDIDPGEIVNAINELPIPEEIQYPVENLVGDFDKDSDEDDE